MNRICIFGSTGNVGRKAIQVALEKGLQVTVLVRNPSTIPDEHRSKITVIEGDVKNLSDVSKAIKDQDGIVVILGTGRDLGPTTIMSEGIKNITEAMKTHGIDKVSVCISAFLFMDYEKVPKIFHEVTKDHKRMYDILKLTDFNWIAVFPPQFIDGPSSNYEVKHDENPGKNISKINLAKFLIDSLTMPEHYKRVCGIANK